jgi:hypothetical protein
MDSGNLTSDQADQMRETLTPYVHWLAPDGAAWIPLSE